LKFNDIQISNYELIEQFFNEELKKDAKANRKLKKMVEKNR
jgi:hypothetical protein